MRISDWSSDVCSSDLDWMVRNSGWYLAAYLCAFYGVLVILSLYLDRRRPDLKTALGHALRLLPRYLLSAVLIGLPVVAGIGLLGRSEEHTSELQSLMRISYAVFCLKKKKQYNIQQV